ncbi:L-threonylcarbamoyladenylate synthase [Deinococcus kurensis]|uniref:L-threonylcarbamoyladenylate synthase n=1 Tax=Deinococcus kurensis TaxID=2662757 RepID=UPI001F478548|nr:L-threonylcarbamoyladenylate synthase [Deinococcus kurensis]
MTNRLTSRQPDVPWAALLLEAARVLRAGGVVAYPSETVWGLAALPDAAAQLFRRKGRDEGKPVQGSFLDLEAARAFVQPDRAFEALAVFLPGPLTLVTPASAACPAALAPGGRVGVRVPDHPVAQALLAQVGGVLATTSCNRSGEAAALTFAQARALDLADLVLPDAGVPAQGLPSTVLDVPARRVLREGAVPAARVLAALDGLA